MTANQARNTIGVSTLVYLVSLFMLLVLLPSCQRDAPVSPSGSSSSVSTTPDDNGGGN